MAHTKPNEKLEESTSRPQGTQHKYICIHNRNNFAFNFLDKCFKYNWITPLYTSSSSFSSFCPWSNTNHPNAIRNGLLEHWVHMLKQLDIVWRCFFTLVWLQIMHVKLEGHSWPLFRNVNLMTHTQNTKENQSKPNGPDHMRFSLNASDFHWKLGKIANKLLRFHRRMYARQI